MQATVSLKCFGAIHPRKDLLLLFLSEIRLFHFKLTINQTGCTILEINMYTTNERYLEKEIQRSQSLRCCHQPTLALFKENTTKKKRTLLEEVQQAHNKSFIAFPGLNVLGVLALQGNTSTLFWYNYKSVFLTSKKTWFTLLYLSNLPSSNLVI